MISVLKERLIHSTIHGFPNVIQEFTLSARIMWLIFSTGALIGFIVHSMMMIEILNSEPIMRKTFPRSVPFSQPDIVICPENLFALDYLHQPPKKDRLLMEQLNEQVQDIDRKWNVNNTNPFWSPNVALWSSVNWANYFHAFYHRENQLLLDFKCNFQSKSIKLKFEENWLHFACFRLTKEDCDLADSKNQLSIVLYIHSHNAKKEHKNEIMPTLNGYPLFIYGGEFGISDGIADGFTVYFLSPKETVEHDSTKVTAVGGKMTYIGLKSVEHDLVNTKRSSCTNNPTEYKHYNRISYNHSSAILSFTDMTSCYLIEVQKEIYRQFNCTAPILPITTEIPSGSNCCLNVSQPGFNKKTVEQFLKVYNWTLIEKKMHECRHVRLCKYHKYETLPNFLDWPHQKLLKDILTNFYYLVHNLSNSDEFPGITEAFEEASKTNHFDDWKQNFVKIIIRPLEFQSTKIEESISYELKNLFSDCGGILGFYIGASLLTICELFGLAHYFIHLCLVAHFKKDRKQSLAIDTNDKL